MTTSDTTTATMITGYSPAGLPADVWRSRIPAKAQMSTRP